MISIYKFFISWFTGGVLYFAMEIMMRGYSHFSMFICGGLCFVLVGITGNEVLATFDSVVVAILGIMILGTIIISSLEFITGVIVNVILGLQVWDYSNLEYNLLGQICPMFSGIWCLISLPCVYIDSLMRKYIYGEDVKYIRRVEKYQPDLYE